MPPPPLLRRTGGATGTELVIDGGYIAQ